MALQSKKLISQPGDVEARQPELGQGGPPAVGRSLWSDAYRRLRRDRAAVACFIVIMLYALVAIASPVFFAGWSERHDYDHTNLSPSLAHPLGTDALGRSVFQKTLLGAKTSLSVALMASIIAVPLGILLGALAGYYGGRIDDIIVWMYTTLLAIPGIILLVALKFAFKDVVIGPPRQWYSLDLDQGLSGIYIALGVLSWIGTCRLVRAETMKIRELDYVMAARATGSHSVAILFRHVVPNVLHLGIIQFSLGFIGAIGAEVILSYLGLGVGVGVPSWGSMINAARMDLVVGRWWELASAVGAMFFLVLALNIFGDRLRDAFDPRLRTA